MTWTPGHPPELPQEVIESLWRGNRGEAIELLQRELQIGREEARELVAAYILSNRAVQRRMDDGQSKLSWRVIRWVILFQAIAVAIGYFMLFRE